jgi:hypothetical protein
MKHMHTAFATCTTLALVLLLQACRRNNSPQTPEGAYRLFGQVLRSGDATAAFAMLTRESRKQMEAKTSAIADASQGMIRNEPALILFQSGVAASDVDTVVVTEETSERATVVVEPNGPRITLLREDGRWAIDLTSLLNN